jgi:hypothetical protein
VTRIGRDVLCCYIGEFSLTTGLSEGVGVLYNGIGNKYSGEFKDGQRHGEGLYETENGSYKGSFFEGKQHGKGTQTLKDGRVFSGEWNLG